MQMACYKAYHFYVANQELYEKKTANQIKRQTNKTNTRTQINSRDFLN